MREIVHLHLGPRASHLATHQWNIAESLFAFSDEDVDHGVEHDVDWRQGIARNGDETYMPRMMLVDLKENFGALPNINALYNTESDDEDDLDEEQAQLRPQADGSKPLPLATAEKIAPSPYQTFLSSGEDDSYPPELANPRYWSDYNRVFYHPRSLMPLEPRFKSQNLEGANGMGKWEEGNEAWQALKMSELFEDSFRLFAEECDLLQGVQVGLDMSTGFGTLASSIIEEVVKDEFPKGEVLALGLLGSIGPSTNPWAGMQRVFTESATLLSLTSNNALVLPLSDLAATSSSTSFPVPLDPTSPYESSAFLAAHLSSALLPLRAKRDRGQMGMSDFAGRLNWRGDTRVLGMEGSVPVWDVKSAERGRLDFSIFRAQKAEEGSAVDDKVTPFYSHTVLRGIPPASLPLVLENLQTKSGLKGALFSPLTARPPLPLAAPFPRRIFGNDPPLTAIPISTSITTSTSTRHYLSHLIDNVAEFVRTRQDARFAAMGDAFGRDEAREMEEALRSLKEAYVEEDEDDREEPSGDERE